MNAAMELIRTVEANGGHFHVEDGFLVIAPAEAAKPVMIELRQHKAEIIGLLQPEGPLPVDPEEWRESFVQWLDSACALHPRAFGGVAALHIAYCEREIAQDGVPCNRETFERLLAELGFLMGEVKGIVLVSGLTFRKDVEVVEF